MREELAFALEEADGKTWRALVGALDLDLDALLQHSPEQRAKLAAAQAAPPAPAPHPAPPPPPVAASPALDAALYAQAEALDVSPKKLRAAFAALLSEVERQALTPAAARALLIG
jgi:hypothetical protein